MTFPLLEDTERRDACPVASLVALAIADGALVGISTVEDLRKVRIKQTRTVENIAIVPDMAEVPIFRASLGRGRAISGSRIVCFDQYQHHLQSVADRAGYNSRFTTYHIRRGHGAVLDSKATASISTSVLIDLQTSSLMLCDASVWDIETPAPFKLI
jgi:hypothetical protein